MWLWWVVLLCQLFILDKFALENEAISVYLLDAKTLYCASFAKAETERRNTRSQICSEALCFTTGTTARYSWSADQSTFSHGASSKEGRALRLLQQPYIYIYIYIYIFDCISLFTSHSCVCFRVVRILFLSKLLEKYEICFIVLSSKPGEYACCCE